MAAPSSPDAIRDVNTRYHDLAATSYDAKWGIDFNDVFQDQVLSKLRKALGVSALGPWERSLEIGAGTGYFSLNLLRAGVVTGRATATDISPGMLSALRANAARLGFEVETKVCDAEHLPFDDESFDVVLGHAILHHIPDLEQAFREFHRVLAPGGVVVFAGEPSRYGDRIANVPKRGAAQAAPVWRRLVGAQPHGHDGNGHGHAPSVDDEHALESQVDVHAFAPADLRAPARAAGFDAVRVRGEELLANWFGWTNRTLEASAEPSSVPLLWRRYAYHGYLALQRVDRALLEPRLPPEIFYNLMVSGRKG